MELYHKPLSRIHDLPIISRLQGTGDTIPVIPECSGSATADCAETTGLGISCCSFCGDNASSLVHIWTLLPGSDCNPSPNCSIQQLHDGQTSLDTSNCSQISQTACTDGCVVEFECEYTSGSGVCFTGPNSFSASINCDGQTGDCTPQPAT